MTIKKSIFEILQERNRAKKELRKTRIKLSKINWIFARIRHYENIIDIGCGGDAENAIKEILKFKPVIDQHIRLVNPDYSGSDISLEGGHVNIRNLDGFVLEIFWIFIGWLCRDGWIIQKRQVEGQEKNRPVIDMLHDDYTEITGK